MWMQVFVASGFTVMGEAFPKGWGDSALRAANPSGFYESVLRDGIYFATNPHPATGRYFEPQDAERYVCKVFIPGVVRTERAYLEYVVANIRPWREYEASVARLWALEDEAREEQAPGAPAPYRIPGALEWWLENYALIRDIFVRDYPACIFTYDQVLADPEKHVGAVLDDLGVEQREAALSAIEPRNRTIKQPESDSVDPAIAQVFDDLYAAVDRGEEITDALMNKLADTHAKLLPQLQDVKRALLAWMLAEGLSPPGLLPNVP